MPETILVIEDEPGIVDFLDRGLRAHGFDVISALDGLSGSEKAINEHVDLVVLDMMLPGRSGLEVLAGLRTAKPGLPVIALTARGEVEDRVKGLDAGAADYLTKPFSLNELAARIRAQLRVAAQAPATALSAGELEMDLITREVSYAGEPVRLSTTEFELLAYLLRNRGRVLGRDQILRAVWGYDYDPGTNVVDVYVGYLRRKLRRGSDRSPIVTVRSVGYRLDAE
ncbi:MAG: two-component system, OmpR family, response regulator [Solirubrobacteraceae bacterium]|jgi:DNA-binding response OmpR family regulator|nr:two-component system, OmpR family, response regulator [Solirubrobacteraceae bacterium]